MNNKNKWHASNIHTLNITLKVNKLKLHSDQGHTCMHVYHLNSFIQLADLHIYNINPSLHPLSTNVVPFWHYWWVLTYSLVISTFCFFRIGKTKINTFTDINLNLQFSKQRKKIQWLPLKYFVKITHTHTFIHCTHTTFTCSLW